MTMRALFTSALIATALAPAPAHADKTASRAGWLDADAPVVVSVRPALLPGAAGLLADTLGADDPKLGGAIAALGAASEHAVGADLLSRAGWQTAGLDPDAPVLISLAAIDDAAAAQVYDRLFELDTWSDAALRRVRKTYWRSRAVIAIDDPKRATRAVHTLAKHVPELYRVHEREAAEIALLVGGSAAKAESVVKRLRKRKILAIGWIAGFDSVIAFRIDARRRLLLVDVVGSFAGVPTVWSRDSRKVLAAIERNPGSSKLPAVLRRGAGARALRADLAVWLQPTALLDLAKATGRHSALQALARRAPTKARRRALHQEATAEIEQCDRFRDLATRGPFADLALTVELDERAARVRATWGLRKAYKLAGAMLVHDDGLLKWGSVNGAVVVAAHYLRGFGPLRALPRPRVMKQGFGPLAEAMRRCGGGAESMVALFGWPALIGQALDDARGEDASAAAVIDGARNGALVIETLGARQRDAVIAAALSFDAGGAEAVADLLEPLLGAGETERLAGRAVTLWRAAPLVGFRFSLGREISAIGAAIGGDAVARFAGAVGPSADPPIARWSVDLAAIGGTDARDAPAWLAALAARADLVEGTLAVDRGTLTATTTLHLR